MVKMKLGILLLSLALVFGYCICIYIGMWLGIATIVDIRYTLSRTMIMGAVALTLFVGIPLFLGIWRLKRQWAKR